MPVYGYTAFLKDAGISGTANLRSSGSNNGARDCHLADFEILCRLIFVSKPPTNNETCDLVHSAVIYVRSKAMLITASEAIKKLKDGNQRFVSGIRSIDTKVTQLQRSGFVEGQQPFAIILGCSDSRVPAEIIFDQGLGDLFVIRIAGNIVAPSQVGSVEFAVKKFGMPIVVVLGHSMCGAVMATIDELERPSGEKSSNVLSIVNRIRPAIEPLFETDMRNDPGKLLESSIHANILAATNHLMHGSQMLEHLVHQGNLTIVGAEYSLETGEVKFFE
jgi:carbonic anhydrase